MSDALKLQELPTAENIIMIVGWRQWADAGSISSGLPKYLIKHLDARKIGYIKPDDFYIFQIPGMHDLLRPVIKLKDGYRQSFEEKRNEFFYAGDEAQGIVIFLGDEPHMKAGQYSQAFFQAAKALGVSKIVGVAGVYGPTPYNKDRYISCIYSMPHMRETLNQYALNFSNYEGGSSIGSYLVEQAEYEEIEFIIFYGFVPYYDFSEDVSPQGIRIEQDYKAWYDIMTRYKHMLGLKVDLTDLQNKSYRLIETIDAKINELETKNPKLQIRQYIEQLDKQFTELSFIPLDDIWEQEMKGLFDDLDG